MLTCGGLPHGGPAARGSPVVTRQPHLRLAGDYGRAAASVRGELGIAPHERPLGVALRPWPSVPGWEDEVLAALRERLATESNQSFLLLPCDLTADLELHRRLAERLAAPGRTILAGRPLSPPAAPALGGAGGPLG